MIEILEMEDSEILGFKVDGRIGKDDLEHVFTFFEEKLIKTEKRMFYIEISNFNISEFSTEALKEDLKFWVRNPGLIASFSKIALVADTTWIRNIFSIECALIPTLEGKSFSFGERSSALEWLKTDQRAGKRIDVTLSEFAETSALKFAGGFALGLFASGLLAKTQRRNIATAVLLGTFAAALPLGIKMLNNNRQLLTGSRSGHDKD